MVVCSLGRFSSSHAAIRRSVTWLESHENNQRGEFVLILSRPSIGEAIEAEMAQTQALERVLEILLDELPLKQAVALAVKLTGEKKNLVYELALGLRQANSPNDPL